jgi:glycosyltransferase involved in cell wall biosynthesis
MSHRLLLVTDSYPPMIGGADRATQVLARGLAHRGHDVMVATTWQKNLPTVDVDGPVSVRRVRDLTSRMPFVSSNPYQHIPPPFPDPEAIVRFRRLIREFRPDVVHAYGWIAYSCAVALVGTDIPLVVCARDYGNFCPVRTLLHNDKACDGPEWRRCLSHASAFYSWPKGIIATASVLGSRQWLARGASGLQSNSTFTEQVTLKHLFGINGRQPERNGLIHRPIPSFRPSIDEVDPTNAKLANLPDEPFILFVGALRRVKGLHQLLDAHHRLERRPPLVLIGTRATDTPKTFPDDVHVIHDVPNAAVLAAWDRAVFGVFPSLWPEPFGNVVHEAMSRGRAVIGTTPGGHRDMIENGVNGFLVPAGEVGSLAAAMQCLVDDVGLRAKMGRASVAMSRRFTSSALLPEFEALFDEVVQAGRSRRLAG